MAAASFDSREYMFRFVVQTNIIEFDRITIDSDEKWVFVRNLFRTNT